jgi:hypothetical protein
VISLMMDGLADSGFASNRMNVEFLSYFLVALENFVMQCLVCSRVMHYPPHASTDHATLHYSDPVSSIRRMGFE